MKEIGIMECLMEKAHSSLKTDRDTKVLLRKINSMGMECSTRTTR